VSNSMSVCNAKCHMLIASQHTLGDSK